MQESELRLRLIEPPRRDNSTDKLEMQDMSNRSNEEFKRGDEVRRDTAAFGESTPRKVSVMTSLQGRAGRVGGQSVDVSAMRNAAAHQVMNASQIEEKERINNLKQRRVKLAFSVAVFNYWETVGVGLLLLNCLLYPNYISAVYLAYTLILFASLMTRVHTNIKAKFYLSIFMLVAAWVTFASKCRSLRVYSKERGHLPDDEEPKGAEPDLGRDRILQQHRDPNQYQKERG